jgi:subtilisin family serine protease
MPQRRRSARPLALAVALAALALPAVASAASERPLAAGPAATGGGPAPASDRLIVVWEDGVERAERLDARADADAAFVRTLGDPRFQLLRTESGRPAGAALAQLRADPAVRSAVRETYDVPHATTNDPLLGQLWGLQNVGAGVAGFAGALAGADLNALAAWDRTRGTPSAVVAVLDSGYRFDHPDLGPVAWSNPADPPNGADDDGNGIVDDWRGADFVGFSANTPAVDGDPTDDDLIDGGHGVHTAGTIGAAGNNGVGVSGVAQDARIMPLRVCSYYRDDDLRDGDQSGTVCPSTAQIQAINYAGSHGARVVNMSLGGTNFNAAVRDAFAANPNVLFVISAGNLARDNDAAPQYPCNYEPQTSGIGGAIDNVVCVAATDQADRLAGFSQWGARSVDVGAPGTEILSTYPYRLPLDETFAVDDFAARWLPRGRDGGFARTDEAPLESFGMSDSPSAAPVAGSVRASRSVAVTVPPNGGCELEHTRRVVLGLTGRFRYAVYLDGVEEEALAPGSTTVAGLDRRVLELPPTFDAGGSVSVEFRFEAGAVPSPGSGVWLDDVELRCVEPVGQTTGFGYLDGTSMAAPHVSGAAALLLSLNPAATTAQVRAALLATVDPLGSLAGRTTTGGRVDAASALDEIRQPDTRIASAPPRSTRSRRVSLAFTRSDAPLGGGFECQLDGAAFAACASPVAYRALRGGRHTFAVRARSPRGVLVDPTPATASWTVTQCKVPRLRGKTLVRARRALRRARCRLGRVVRPRAARGARARRRRAARPLVVRGSRPRAGAVRTHGARVRLTLTVKPRARARARRRARRR